MLTRNVIATTCGAVALFFAGCSTEPDTTVDAGAQADSSSQPVAPVLVADGGTASDAAVNVTDASPATTQCNPVQPFIADATHIACAAGQSCGFMLPDENRTSCAGPTGPGLQGVGCNAIDDCSAGYDCIVLNEHGRCARYCRVGSSFNDCGSEYSCSGFLSPAHDGAQEIGVCL